MPDSIDWDKLKTFHAAARSGSLTRAAEDLGISQSAVSRQIAALEEGMNLPLFHRHARGLTLTEEGTMLFKTASDVHGRIVMSLASVQNIRKLPQGALRVSSPISLGSNWLTTVLPEFMTAYPEIEVQLILEDSEHDLMAFDVDCALRPWPSTQGDLIERKLGQITQSLYAAPSYLAEFGAPTSARDLDNHKIVAFGNLLPSSKLQSSNWDDDRGPRTIRGASQAGHEHQQSSRHYAGCRSRYRAGRTTRLHDGVISATGPYSTRYQRRKFRSSLCLSD